MARTGHPSSAPRHHWPNWLCSHPWSPRWPSSWTATWRLRGTSYMSKTPSSRTPSLPQRTTRASWSSRYNNIIMLQEAQFSTERWLKTFIYCSVWKKIKEQGKLKARDLNLLKNVTLCFYSLQQGKHLQKQLAKLQSSLSLLSKKILFMHRSKFQKLKKFHRTAKEETCKIRNQNVRKYWRLHHCADPDKNNRVTGLNVVSEARVMAFDVTKAVKTWSNWDQMEHSIKDCEIKASLLTGSTVASCYVSGNSPPRTTLVLDSVFWDWPLSVLGLHLDLFTDSWAQYM